MREEVLPPKITTCRWKVSIQGILELSWMDVLSNLGYFVGVKTIILNHIKNASKIPNLRHFCPWAISSVNHRKKDLLKQSVLKDSYQKQEQPSIRRAREIPRLQ